MYTVEPSGYVGSEPYLDFSYACTTPLVYRFHPAVVGSGPPPRPRHFSLYPEGRRGCYTVYTPVRAGKWVGGEETGQCGTRSGFEITAILSLISGGGMLSLRPPTRN